MQDILTALLGNLDALSLSIATALATGIVLTLKGGFSLVRKLAEKTPTALDDKIVDQTEAVLKDKAKDI